MARIFNTAKRLNAILGGFPNFRRKIDQIFQEYHQIQENWSYEMGSNGERWLLETLASKNLLETVFDVGANHGDWTKLALQANPAAAIHCFEICPPTFQKLTAALSPLRKSVSLNSFGLSDAPGEVQIKFSPDGDDGLSTMFDPVFPEKMVTLTGQVLKGRDYCTQHNLHKISLLKIDVEGAEHLVLKGFEDMLTPEKVPVVQFEYGQVNIITKFLLRDFHAFFESRGYVLGKLFPKSVEFRKYRFQDENFLGPNYIAASPQIATQLAAKG